MSAILKDSEFSKHIADVFGYAESVLSGRKLACKLEVMACKRFFADIKKNEFEFSHEKSERVIDFIETLPHVSGRWAKEKKRLELEPWQKFMTANIFGWVDKATGLRRYRLAYIKVPRKNAKSTWVAGVCLYMLLADGEHAAEVLCGATNESQAWKVFEPAREMVLNTPKLRKSFGITVNAKSLHARKNSKFYPVIGKPGDGGSPSCATHDEFHEHKTLDQFSTMATGMGAREQPLQIVITTAGTNVVSPCYQLERDVERVLRGDVENDSVFGLVYGIDDGDDWTTEAALIKANPNYGVSVDPKEMRIAQRFAMQNPAHQNDFKTKHLNVWCWARTAFFNAQKWLDLGDKSLDMADFKDDPCYIGLDLAQLYDISAMSIVFVRSIDGIKHYYVFSRNYLPEETITNNDVPQLQEMYRRNLQSGDILIGGGYEMDLRVVSDEIIRLKNEGYNILEVPHDPRFAQLLVADISEAGLLPVQITQHGTYLTPGMTEIEAAIASGRIHHDSNEITNWCIGNVQAKQYPNGGMLPTKENKQSKIDAAVAMIMAVARAQLGEVREQYVGVEVW